VTGEGSEHEPVLAKAHRRSVGIRCSVTYFENIAHGI